MSVIIPQGEVPGSRFLYDPVGGITSNLRWLNLSRIPIRLVDTRTNRKVVMEIKLTKVEDSQKEVAEIVAIYGDDGSLHEEMEEAELVGIRHIGFEGSIVLCLEDVLDRMGRERGLMFELPDNPGDVLVPPL